MKYYIILLSIAVILSACEVNQKEIQPENEFIKIYNHPDTEIAYHPAGILQLSDGGYLILSGVKVDTSVIEYPHANLIKTNSLGEVEWTRDYDLFAPSPRLFQRSGSVGFVAMDLQLNAYAVEINTSNGDVAGQNDLQLTMPLYSYVDKQNNLIVLGYDFVARSSWISLFDGSFGLQRSVKVNVEKDLENVVQKHMNKSGKQFPFFIGEFTEGSQSGYYVNCFYNYTLRTVFFESARLTMLGNIYSFQTEEAVSSIIQRTGNRYALTRFYSNNNYLLGDVEVDISTSQNFNDITGDILNELVHDAKVLSKQITVGSTSYLLFASQTNSNSMVTYQHAADVDSLITTHYHQFNERVEVADIIQTKEEGVALLGKIYILGKYQRPVLVKLPVRTFSP
ncbi:MAG: hypothetical protein KAI95_05855 [Bacteroidales bacterium]|nr:hypothetical protein [Bacteroidales bacterium]